MRVLFTESFPVVGRVPALSCVICLTSLKEGLPYSPWQLERGLFFHVASGNHPVSPGQQLGGVLVRGSSLCSFFVPDAQVATIRTAAFYGSSFVFSLQAVLWVTVLGPTPQGEPALWGVPKHLWAAVA